MLQNDCASLRRRFGPHVTPPSPEDVTYSYDSAPQPGSSRKSCQKACTAPVPSTVSSGKMPSNHGGSSLSRTGTLHVMPWSECETKRSRWSRARSPGVGVSQVVLMR